MSQASKRECAFCGMLVDPERPGTFCEVTGWAKRRAKGLNALAERVETGRVACLSCMQLRAKGISIKQTRMFGEDVGTRSVGHEIAQREIEHEGHRA